MAATSSTIVFHTLNSGRKQLTMTTPEENYRALLPELLSLYPSLSDIRPKLPHRPVAHVAHGWYMRCHRGIEAVVQLEETGFQEEASPIRRSILEHVVSLKWLAAQGGAVADVLKSGAARDAAKRKESVIQANWTSVSLNIFDEIIVDGMNTNTQHDYLLAFKHRCDKFGTPHDWTTYIIETARSHPCWESAVPYIDGNSSRPRLRVQPDPLIDQAGFCVIHLFEALVAVNQMIETSPLTSQLETLDRQIRSIVVGQRREQGLPIPEGLDSDLDSPCQ